MPTYYEYAVTSTQGTNISTIEDPLEKDTSKVIRNSPIGKFIPDRIVTASFRNPGSSRTTLYNLTEEEAEKLAQYPGVLGVERTDSELYTGTDEDFPEFFTPNKSTEFDVIPFLKRNNLDNPANSASMANPALVYHSLPSSSNYNKFIYNFTENIVDPETPGTGDDQAYTYTSYRTGRNVNIQYCDGYIVANNADFFNSEGTHSYDTANVRNYLSWCMEEYIPFIGPSSYNTYLTIRNMFRYPPTSGQHGTQCQSLVTGQFCGNAVNANVIPRLSAKSVPAQTLLRNFYESSSVNPSTGEKTPLILGQSSGYSSPNNKNLVDDFRRNGGRVSGSFNFNEVIGSKGGFQGIRINYENIDYLVISGGADSSPIDQFQDFQIGNLPIPHKQLFINSTHPSDWAARLNNACDFLTVNYDNDHIHLTSSEDIKWYITIYTGSYNSLRSFNRPDGGHLLLNLSGSAEEGTKPTWNIKEWAPLGTPIGLASDGGTASKYAAPRADYQFFCPNKDHHGIDNGFNLPFGSEHVPKSVFQHEQPAGASSLAEMELMADAGIIYTNAAGNEKGRWQCVSSSANDPYHRPEHKINLSVKNPLTGELITGHPYNSYFVVDQRINNLYRKDEKIYYNRDTMHHSVIRTSNITPYTTESANGDIILYNNRYVGQIGNQIAANLYGTQTRTATTILGNDSEAEKNNYEISASSLYQSENSYYNLQGLVDLYTFFTSSYNKLVELYPPDIINDNTKAITSSSDPDKFNDEDFLYFCLSGLTTTPNRQYSINGDNSSDNPITFPIERTLIRFGGSSAANPLLTGFIAGYLEENPSASVNDIKAWIDYNSYEVIETTSSADPFPMDNPFDGYFVDGGYGVHGNPFLYPYRFVSGSTTGFTYVKHNAETYAPFTSKKIFLFPYTNIPEQVEGLKIKNATLKGT